jgi:hypothetical protein
MNKLGYAGFKFNHSDFITELVKQLNCESYLELGVYDGVTLSKVKSHVNRLISVDIKDLRKEKIGEFHLTTTDNFFKEFNDKIDFIFIDADHSFESVKKDFKNSIKILSPLGMVVLHDTDPIEEKYLSSGYCGDSYKMDGWIRENYPDLDVMTLPITEAGLTLVKRKLDNRVNNFIKND